MKKIFLLDEKGVALLMALGVLVIMSVLGISFAASMRLGEKGCKAFLWNTQAKYLAEGGIARVIADLKYNTTQGAVNKFLDDGAEDWYSSDGTGNDIEDIADPSYEYFATSVSQIESAQSHVDYSGNIIGTVKLKVIDTGSQINVNDSNNPDLQNILDNLGLDSDESENLVNYIQNAANPPFLTKKDITLIPQIGPAGYEAVKDYITVSSYNDPSNNDKAAININTASSQVLDAIFQTVAADEALALRNAIINHGTFNSLSELRTVIEETSADPSTVISAIDPNYTDTDDATQNHTKFIFNSGGRYEIECLARVGITRAEPDTLENDEDVILAQKKIKTVVQVFSMWNQTTKEQFQGDVDVDGDGNYDVADGDIDFNGDGDVDDLPDYKRITWLDSCPVNTDDDWNSAGYNTIPGSLKLGYWDDFEDNAYSRAQWLKIAGGPSHRLPEYDIKEGPYTHPSNVLDMSGGHPCYWLCKNIDSDAWVFKRHFIYAQVHDAEAYLYRGVSMLCFRGDPISSTTDSSILHTGGLEDPDAPQSTAFRIWKTEHTSPDGGLTTAKTYTTRVGVNQSWVTWYVQIDDNNNVYAKEVKQEGDPNEESNVHTVHLDNGAQNSEGIVRLYRHTDDPGNTLWDNIRIIPTEGNYTSIAFQPEQGNTVEWGAVFGTVAIPETASADTETVEFSTSIDDYASTIASGESIGGSSASINYRAILSTEIPEDNYTPFETPVLEDVWITYLPRTKILYWKEG